MSIALGHLERELASGNAGNVLADADMTLKAHTQHATELELREGE